MKSKETVKKKNLKFGLSAFSIILILIIFLAILTHFLPAAQFSGEKLVDGSGVVKATLANILMSPVEGFAEAIDVCIFIFVLGGFLNIVSKTGALETGVRVLVEKLKGRELLLIPILMFLFSIGGTTYGMLEETVGFYALLAATMVAARMDTIVASAVVLLGAGCGVLGSTINPFANGVAISALKDTGIAVDQGAIILIGIALWLVTLGIAIAFVMLYANKVKKDKGSTFLTLREQKVMEEKYGVKETKKAAKKTKVKKVKTNRLSIVNTFGINLFIVLVFYKICAIVTKSIENTLDMKTIVLAVIYAIALIAFIVYAEKVKTKGRMIEPKEEVKDLSAVNTLGISVSLIATVYELIRIVISLVKGAFAVKMVVPLLICTLVLTLFIIHAENVRKNGRLSDKNDLSKKQRYTLIIFGITFLVMIFGFIPWGEFGGTSGLSFSKFLTGTPLGEWWFYDAAVWFLIMAIIIGIINKMKEKEIVDNFIAGAADMMAVILIVAVARGVKYLMGVTYLDNYIIFNSAELLSHMPVLLFTPLNYILHIILSVLVPSSSGLATISAPIIGPIAAQLHYSVEGTIMTMVAANGLVNLITPTCGAIMGGLALAGVEYSTWFKWALKVVAAIGLAALVILMLAMLIF